MNRVRLGLHIPGNVIVACKRCNVEKRRDDQTVKLTLANSGWESFLSHDSTHCETGCKTCVYWAGIWPHQQSRIQNLKAAKQRIVDFRKAYSSSLDWGRETVTLLRERVDSLYRACQDFATSQIRNTVDEAFNTLATELQGRGMERRSEPALPSPAR
jgi:hypothetical protein